MDLLDGTSLIVLTRRIVAAGALAAAAVTAHTLYNLRATRRVLPRQVRIREPVSILIPARNEADRIAPTLHRVLAQEGLDDVEVCVLDDGSTDTTAQIVTAIANDDQRLRLVSGGNDPVPPGWLGKTWACHRLAHTARGSVLVFIDADVHLEPWAIAATVADMRSGDLALLSPYPRQIAVGITERLTQPLVVWLWLAHLPIRLAETRPYPSLAAANGQFIVVDAHAYRVSGGHRAVADEVIEDVALLRSLKRHGFRGIPADGSAISECRMYEGAEQVYRGYEKSLWAAFGSDIGAIAVVIAMLGTYVVPPVCAVVSRDRPTRAWGLLGYLAGVAGRVLIARQTGERVLPDSLAHPASIAALCGLTVASIVARHRGTLSWRGRSITP
jgi:glycosyltransferase involved in cell wall biosynthesis